MMKTRTGKLKLKPTRDVPFFSLRVYLPLSLHTLVDSALLATWARCPIPSTVALLQGFGNRCHTWRHAAWDETDMARTWHPPAPIHPSQRYSFGSEAIIEGCAVWHRSRYDRCHISRSPPTCSNSGRSYHSASRPPINNHSAAPVVPEPAFVGGD